jgi:hypothetical protein
MKFEELKEEFSVQFLVLVIVIGLASGLLTYAISFAERICHYIFTLSGWATYVYIPQCL